MPFRDVLFETEREKKREERRREREIVCLVL